MVTKVPTNLYLSNLPKRLDERNLYAIFSEHSVVSCTILRDKEGK